MKTIVSTSHELVKHWVRLQKDRSYRRSVQSVLVEGKNLLKDVLVRHLPQRLIITEKHRDFCSSFAGECILISESVAAKISAVEEPEGCFAEYTLPFHKIPTHIDHALILDGLQDPGNVGTLFRTALALNLRTIFLIEPCCDPWNPKTIRAAKGAQFDLSIIHGSWDDIPKHGSLIVADIEGEEATSFVPPKNWFLVLGNEAHGHNVPQQFHPRFIKIPMPGPMESLNVSQAGAILIYSLLNK
jgi:TrmH family RNA methyltransferase